MNIPLLVVIITFASFVQASVGFGFSIVALSIMTFFIPLLTGSVVAVLAMLPLTLYIALRSLKDINWKVFIVPFIFAILTTQVGIYFLMVANNSILLKILGIVLVGFALFSLLTNAKIKINPNLPIKIIFGSISGIFSGLFSMGGPPIAIYMLAATKSKEEYSSTLQTYFLATTLIAVLTHLLYGNITKQVLIYSGYAYIGVLIGTIFGRMLFVELSTEKMEKMVYSVMLVMGCIILFKS